MLKRLGSFLGLQKKKGRSPSQSSLGSATTEVTSPSALSDASSICSIASIIEDGGDLRFVDSSEGSETESVRGVHVCKLKSETGESTPKQQPLQADEQGPDSRRGSGAFEPVVSEWSLVDEVNKKLHEHLEKSRSGDESGPGKAQVAHATVTNNGQVGGHDSRLPGRALERGVITLEEEF